MNDPFIVSPSQLLEILRPLQIEVVATSTVLYEAGILTAEKMQAARARAAHAIEQTLAAQAEQWRRDNPEQCAATDLLAKLMGGDGHAGS